MLFIPGVVCALSCWPKTQRGKFLVFRAKSILTLVAKSSIHTPGIAACFNGCFKPFTLTFYLIGWVPDHSVWVIARVCVCADRRVGMCTNTSQACMRSSSPGSWFTGESGVPSTTSPASDASRLECYSVCVAQMSKMNNKEKVNRVRVRAGYTFKNHLYVCVCV